MPLPSAEDVRGLLQDPSEENRARTAGQLAELYRAHALDGAADKMIDEIIRIFAHDAAVLVRKAVAEQLQHDPDLPGDVALSLAHDVEDVAVPILRFSRALSDEDLAKIVAEEQQGKLKAIAGRLTVSESVSDALIRHGDADTVATLFANGGSKPSEDGMLEAVDRFGADDRVQMPLANRPELPRAVMARMVAIVSDHVLKELSAREDLPKDLAADIMQQAEERVFVNLSQKHRDHAELVAELEKLGRLTTNLAMRALISGDIDFFEHAAARIAGLDLNAVRVLAYDTGALGVGELCRRMKVPEKLAAVYESGLATYCSIRSEGGAFDRDRFQARMIERMLTAFDGFGDTLDTDDVDAVVGRLRSIA